MRPTVVLAVLASASSWGAPVLAALNVADGGWFGPGTCFECTQACDDVFGALLEVRMSGGAFGDSTSCTEQLAFYVANECPDLVHLQPLSYRFTVLYVDGGLGAMSPEVAARADLPGQGSVPPTGVTVIDVDGGFVDLQWNPAQDDGSGVGSYVVYVINSTNSEFYVANFGTTDTSGAVPAGPGTWQLAVQAADQVGNYIGDGSSNVNAVVVASADVSAPSAPVPTPAISSDPVLSVTVSDPADLYVFELQLEDGGITSGPMGASGPVSAPVTFTGYMDHECRFLVRSARFIAGEVSDWSAWSQPLFVDLQPPTAPTAVHVTGIAALEVTLAWDAAFDSCTGVATYTVTATSGGAQVESSTGTTAATLDLAPAGQWSVTVVAIDGAGQASPPSQAINVEVGVADAGADAGRPQTHDAGPDDAGDGVLNPNAPTPRTALSLGCGCGATPQDFVLVWFALGTLALWRRGSAQRRQS